MVSVTKSKRFSLIFLDNLIRKIYYVENDSGVISAVPNFLNLYFGGIYGKNSIKSNV